MQREKLEFTDFSGGITENFIPGTPTQYAVGDNLWITREKDLMSRPGSRLLEGSGAQVPTGGNRVGTLITWRNDAELLAISGQNLFVQDSSGAWVQTLGPTGNPAFVGNTLDNHVSYAEWRNHLILVPDGNSNPQKIYRDENGVLQLREAGLPTPLYIAPITDSQKFSSAVALATSLRDCLVAHFSDVGVGNAHDVGQPTVALSTLTTPANNADLLAYVTLLRSEYYTHVTDAQKYGFSPTPRVYHVNAQIFRGTINSNTGYYGVLNIGLDLTLQNFTMSDDDFLDKLILELNDLRDKYNWHTYATLTHANAWISNNMVKGLPFSYAITLPTNLLGFGKNVCPLPSINIDDSLVASGQLQNLLTYVNNLQLEYSLHCSNRTAGNAGLLNDAFHFNADTDNAPWLPNATTLHSAIRNLAILEALFTFHYGDAKFDGSLTTVQYTPFRATMTSGSGTLTSVGPNGFTTVGFYFLPMTTSTVGNSASTTWLVAQNTADRVPKVIASTSTTTTISSTATNSLSQWVFVATSSRNHFSEDLTGQGTGLMDNLRSRLALLDYSMDSITNFIAECQNFYGLLKTHQTASTAATSFADPLDSSKSVFAYSVDSTGHQFNFSGVPQYTGPVHQMAQVVLPLTANYAAVTNYQYYNTENIPLEQTVLYTLVYRYDYEVGNIDFIDVSPPALATQILRVQSPPAVSPLTGLLYPTTISNIPVLANTTLTNYDVDHIVVDIYRTTGNGDVFYKVGEIPNGTTTFVDNVSDEDLQANEQLYTTGGVVPNSPPPRSKYVTIVNNIAYYGGIWEGDEFFPYRVRQAIFNDPDSVPETFFDDLDDDIVGLSNFRSYPIALCTKSVYRLENTFGETGTGYIRHERIADTVGCVAEGSIVRTEFGVFFCGTNGIYWTDGYTIKHITTDLETTYGALIQSSLQRSRINVTYLRDSRRVIWSFMSDPGGIDCNISWTLDLNWPIADQASFTTMSGGTSYAPSAMAFYQGDWIRGDSRGYIFRHNIQWKSDPRVSIAQDYTNWTLQPIIYDFQSCATDFGTAKYKKWATRVDFQGGNNSNLSLQISHKTDLDNGGWADMVPVRYRVNPLWGDPLFIWGSNQCEWGFEGMIDDYRRFPAGSLRCDWKQIRMTNAYTIVCNSDTYGVANTSADVAGIVTVTFTNGASLYKWPLQSVDNYSIFFLDVTTGLYTLGGPILSRTDTTLTLATGTVPVSQTSLRWEIKGVPVDERLRMVSFNITYSPLSDEKHAYHGATSSGGGANK